MLFVNCTESGIHPVVKTVVYGIYCSRYEEELIIYIVKHFTISVSMSRSQ